MKTLFFAIIAFAVVAAVEASADNSVKGLKIDCTPPTQRTDNSVFSTADVGSYLFVMTKPGATTQSLNTAPPPCTYTVAIAPGTCIAKGTVFPVSVSDKMGTWSDQKLSAPLAEDMCNALPKPLPPSAVTITIVH